MKHLGYSTLLADVAYAQRNCIKTSALPQDAPTYFPSRMGPLVVDSPGTLDGRVGVWIPDGIPEGAMRVAPGSDALVWKVSPEHSGEL